MNALCILTSFSTYHFRFLPFFPSESLSCHSTPYHIFLSFKLALLCSLYFAWSNSLKRKKKKKKLVNGSSSQVSQVKWVFFWEKKKQRGAHKRNKACVVVAMMVKRRFWVFSNSYVSSIALFTCILSLSIFPYSFSLENIIVWEFSFYVYFCCVLCVCLTFLKLSM